MLHFLLVGRKQAHALLLVLAVALLLTVPGALSQVDRANAGVAGTLIMLEPSADTTIFSDPGDLSNGAGSNLFAGMTVGLNNSNEVEERRALLKFDLSAIPAGSTINSASVTINVDKANNNTGYEVALHRLTADWGEGTSNSDNNMGGGGGAAATMGDATWTNNFFDTQTWTTPGGDFAEMASASTTVGGADTYFFGNQQMVADVQSWLDNPSQNYGWIVVNNGMDAGSAKRFASSENATASNRPMLTIDYTPGAQSVASQLLLTELVVTPTAGEFIEIYNPGVSPVDLTNVHLTDATFTGDPSTFYYNIVTGSNAGGGSFSDFFATFPNGASIPAGGYQTIALNGSDNFMTTYGMMPTYELFEDGQSADAVPDMLETFAGSIDNQGGLTNGGEVVVLFFWDGMTDLVTDLDYALWGDKAEGVSKTGIAIDGPDQDTDTSTYLADTSVNDQDIIANGAHAAGSSWQREDLTEGAETKLGGNGADGHNETSEDLSNTWCESNAPTPNAATDCGTVVNPVTLAIYEIQGAGRTSTVTDQLVTTTGVVTGEKTGNNANGFFIQDATGDSDDATSDGIFVYTDDDSAGTAILDSIMAGDEVTVTGTVVERFGQTAFNNTGLQVTVNSSGNELPAPVLISSDQRRIPSADTIDNDGNTSFDPAEDPLDFFESLEGMRVQVAQNSQVVGPTNRFGESHIVNPDAVMGTVGPRTTRGGIHITPTDFNPERIMIDQDILDTEDIDVGDTLTTPVVGVLDYTFDEYKIQMTEPIAATDGALQPELSPITGGPNVLTVAAYNVENFADGDSRAGGIALQIIFNLNNPDIIALQEIQDNTGATDDGVVDASQSAQDIIDAVVNAGGPTYNYVEIAPENNQDGGRPGANIRVGYLYNPARVTLVNRTPGDATTPVAVVNNSGAPELSANPGRVLPTTQELADAFFESRKPLAAEFQFNGQTFFLVNVHFNSKGGDDALFGEVQPPVLSSEVQRLQQAEVVNSFVDSILQVDENANVIVLGDTNDFEFSNPLTTLKGDDLVNLVENVPSDERYTFIFRGNSQVLDNLLVSNSLVPISAIDIVHANTEYRESVQVSDHDPLIASFDTTPTGPAVTNGDFANNLDSWVAFNLNGDASTGVAELTRNDTLQNGILAQNLNTGAIPANTSYDVSIDLGNTSNQSKYVTLLLWEFNNFNNFGICFFTVPANTPLATYTLQTNVGPSGWNQADLWLFIDDFSNPSLQVDNVSVTPSQTPVTQTNCGAPLVDNGNMVVNGGFDIVPGFEDAFYFFSDATTRQVTNNVLEMTRGTLFDGFGTPQIGLLAQTTRFAPPANTQYQASVQMGNSSDEAKLVRLDVLATGVEASRQVCLFVVPPNTSLQTYTLQAVTPGDWFATDVVLFVEDFAEEWLQVDDVNLSFQQGQSVSEVTCTTPLVDERNLLLNGDFEYGNIFFGTFGTIITDVAPGFTDFFLRATTNTPERTDVGAIFQPVFFDAPAGSAFEVSVILENPTAETKGVALQLYNFDDPSDALFCFFELPPFTPAAQYVMQGVAQNNWTSTSFEFFLEDGAPVLFIDDFSVQSRPNDGITGLSCPSVGAASTDVQAFPAAAAAEVAPAEVEVEAVTLDVAPVAPEVAAPEVTEEASAPAVAVTEEAPAPAVAVTEEAPAPAAPVVTEEAPAAELTTPEVAPEEATPEVVEAAPAVAVTEEVTE